MTEHIFHNQESEVLFDNSSGLVVKTQQLIPDHFIEQNRADYLASQTVKAGEFHQVASIPIAVVEKWRREGFDILGDENIKIQDIMKRLRAEDFTDFITSAKRI